MGLRRPDLAGLVLAAGAGTRLAPLSTAWPKPLCPVGNVALLDLAVARLSAALRPDGSGEDPAEVATSIAVNICHGRRAVETHLDATAWGRQVHRSLEAGALGTAGAVGPLRPWLDGRALLIVNGDTWCPGPLRRLVEAWDGERIAVAVVGPPPLHARSPVVASILPWADARVVEPEPAGLWERFWRPRLAEDRLQSIGLTGPFVDCGTPADYLRANMAARELAVGAGESTGETGNLHRQARRWGDSLVDPAAVISDGATVRSSVVGAGALVAGRVTRSVLWPGAVVGPGEVLVDCVRTDGGLTVGVDDPGPPGPHRLI